MCEITALFWDLGGVVLSNGWDHQIRRRAADYFRLDTTEFEQRHELVSEAFETGALRLPEYLEHTVFYEPRSFSEDEFRAYMFAQSEPNPGVISILAQLKDSQRFLLAALNNESIELNRHRIDRFDLRSYFQAFFSSCFLGVRKPDVRIYRAVSYITQRRPEECLFIDDREENLQSPRLFRLMDTLRYENTPQLRQELIARGVLRS